MYVYTYVCSSYRREQHRIANSKYVYRVYNSYNDRTYVRTRAGKEIYTTKAIYSYCCSYEHAFLKYWYTIFSFRKLELEKNTVC